MGMVHIHNGSGIQKILTYDDMAHCTT